MWPTNTTKYAQEDTVSYVTKFNGLFKFSPPFNKGNFFRNVVNSVSLEEASDGQWSIDEVTEKLQPSDGDNWNVVFKEVVNLEEKIFEENICDKTPEEYVDYAARHDLTFLTPSGHQIRCKVNFSCIPCSGEKKVFRLAGIWTLTSARPVQRSNQLRS